MYIFIHYFVAYVFDETPSENQKQEKDSIGALPTESVVKGNDLYIYIHSLMMIIVL